MDQIILDWPENASLLGDASGAQWSRPQSVLLRRPVTTPRLSRLRPLAPGELFVLAIPTAALPEFGRPVLTTANVLIYDRALTPLVADILPLGSYAEPAVGDGLERSVRFARDGWSVMRLLDTGSIPSGAAAYAQSVATSVGAAGAPADLVVAHAQVVDDYVDFTEASLADIDVLLGKISERQSQAILFNAFACGCTAALSVTVANGLAG